MSSQPSRAGAAAAEKKGAGATGKSADAMDSQISEIVNAIVSERTRPFSPGGRGTRPDRGLRRRRASASFNDDSQGSSVTFVGSVSDVGAMMDAEAPHEFVAPFQIEQPDRKFSSLGYDFGKMSDDDLVESTGENDSSNKQGRSTDDRSSSKRGSIPSSMHKPVPILSQGSSAAIDLENDPIAKDAAKAFQQHRAGRRLDGSGRVDNPSDEDEDGEGFKRIHHIVKKMSKRPTSAQKEKMKELEDAKKIRAALSASALEENENEEEDKSGPGPSGRPHSALPPVHEILRRTSASTSSVVPNGKGAPKDKKESPITPQPPKQVPRKSNEKLPPLPSATAAKKGLQTKGAPSVPTKAPPAAPAPLSAKEVVPSGGTPASPSSPRSQQAKKS